VNQEYNPERLDVFHDIRGHQGTAVLTFRNDIHGLEDAQAFARSFAAVDRGRKEWWDEKRPDSLDLYGWQATEEVVMYLLTLIMTIIYSGGFFFLEVMCINQSTSLLPMYIL
jgi:hypothetical protein